MKCLAFLFLSVAFATQVVWLEESPMTQSRSDFVAVEVGNFIYCAGGCVANQATSGFCPQISNTFEKYNSQLNQWTTLPAMPRPRYRYAAATVNDKIYYVGGRNLSQCGEFDCLIEEVDVYNIVTNSWSTLAPQSVNIPSDAAAFAIGTKVYVSGGYTLDYLSLPSTLVLDASLTSPMLQAGVVANRSFDAGDSGAESINGKGYVFGGFTSSNNFCTPLTTMEIYDPSNNQWSVARAFVHGRGDMASAVVDGKLWVIGGETKVTCNVSDPVNDVEFYDPSSNTWKDATSTPQDSFRFSGGAYKSTLFVMGGQGNVASGGYYPVQNKVYSLDSLPFSASTLLSPLWALVMGLIVLLATQWI
jgi:N-acetylneuraminic acid mutarotase